MKSVFFCIIICHFSFAQVLKKTFDQEIFWCVYHPDFPNQKNYLFGSFHSNDKRVFDLPDSLYHILNNCPNIVIERNYFQDFILADPRLKIPKVKFDMDGNPYSNITKPTQTFFGDELGMPQFQDILFLESVNCRKNRLYTLNQNTTIEFWKNLKDYKKNIFIGFNKDYRYEQFLDLYLSKDIQQIDRFLKFYLSNKDSSYQKLIVNKSLLIAPTISSMLKENNNSLCVIGVQYFGGNQGLVNLLRKEGFVLNPVEWNMSIENSQLKNSIFENQKTHFYDSISMLHANFSGTPLISYNSDNSKKIIFKELGQGNTYEIDIIPKDNELSDDEIAALHIVCPLNTSFKRSSLDDGTIFYEGFNDTYPEGYSWVRILFKDSHYVVCKAYGGNYFMNSDRAQNFFTNIWFE